MKFLTNLSKAWNACLRHPWYVLYAACIDIISAGTLSAVATGVWTIMVGILSEIYSIMDTMDINIDPEAIVDLSVQQAALNAQYLQIWQWAGILFVSTYAIWSAFQGGAWWIAHKIVREKLHYRYFVPRFLVVTLVAQLVAGGLLMGLGLLVSVLNLGPLVIDEKMTGPIVYAGSIIVFYLQHVAYAVIGNTPFYDAWLNAAYKKWKKMLPAYGVLGSLFVVLHYLAMTLLQLDLMLGAILSAVVVAPAYTFFRIYLIYMVKSVKR